MSNLQTASSRSSLPQNAGGALMIGGVYSDQKCPICGGRFYDNAKDGLYCRQHPEQKATELRISFKGVYRRFKDYDNARQTLEGLRFKFRENLFDKRDYLKSNPLSFASLTTKWLQEKKIELSQRSYNAAFNHIKHASAKLFDKNVKAIGFPELNELRLHLMDTLKSKTIANIFSTLHVFFKWVKKMKFIGGYEIPEFPEIDVVLGYRNYTSKEKQIEILKEIYRLTWDKNPKIYIGILMLCVYPAIRPKELINIREMDFIFEGDVGVNIKLPKERRNRSFKFIPMLKADIDLVKGQIDSRADTRLLKYFRHNAGTSGTPKDHPFSKNILYGWWKRAAGNIGIHDVDLYGGTKHTTVTALSELHSSDDVQRYTQISTNRAFERYLHVDSEQKRILCRDAHPDTVSTRILEFPKQSKASETKG